MSVCARVENTMNYNVAFYTDNVFVSSFSHITQLISHNTNSTGIYHHAVKAFSTHDVISTRDAWFPCVAASDNEHAHRTTHQLPYDVNTLAPTATLTHVQSHNDSINRTPSPCAYPCPQT